MTTIETHVDVQEHVAAPQAAYPRWKTAVEGVLFSIAERFPSAASAALAASVYFAVPEAARAAAQQAAVVAASQALPDALIYEVSRDIARPTCARVSYFATHTVTANENAYVVVVAASGPPDGVNEGKQVDVSGSPMAYGSIEVCGERRDKDTSVVVFTSNNDNVGQKASHNMRTIAFSGSHRGPGR